MCNNSTTNYTYNYACYKHVYFLPYYFTIQLLFNNVRVPNVLAIHLALFLISQT